MDSQVLQHVTTLQTVASSIIQQYPFHLLASKTQSLKRSVPFRWCIRDVLPHLGSIVHKIEHFFAGSNCGFCQPCDVAWRGKDNDVTRVELAVANHAEIIQTYSNTKQWSWSFFLTSARSFKPVSFSPWFVCSATWSVPGLEQLCPELDAVWPPIFWSPSQLAPWDWTTCWSKGQYTALKNRLSSLAVDFFQFLTNALSLAGHLANLTKSFRCKWPAGLGSARCRFPWKPPGESSSVFF